MKFPIREDYDAYLERCIEEEKRQAEKSEKKRRMRNDTEQKNINCGGY